ncbi:hypothetical protein SAY86_026727 [Trapa natans]|uniref:Defensin-like protein n=1 Tax=Trapa natans TaxID=22666 RepID=A0AAN7KM96_TRANT|nr:hypothetical protein SAY86_026727 [Trapa natans]
MKNISLLGFIALFLCVATLSSEMTMVEGRMCTAVASGSDCHLCEHYCRKAYGKVAAFKCDLDENCICTYPCV